MSAGVRRMARGAGGIQARHSGGLTTARRAKPRRTLQAGPDIASRPESRPASAETTTLAAQRRKHPALTMGPLLCAPRSGPRSRAVADGFPPRLSPACGPRPRPEPRRGVLRGVDRATDGGIE